MKRLAPVLLGTGVRLLDGLAPGACEAEQLDATGSPLAAHIRYRIVRPKPGRH